MKMKNNYAFISTDIGTIVYDFNNFSGTLNPIDTLAGYGDDIEIFKNILIIGEDKLHIFDISDINNIEKKAIYIDPNRNFMVDSVNSYVYCRTLGVADYVDIINLTKYVKDIKTLTITSPSTSDTFTEGQQTEITWQSTGTVANVKLNYSLNNGTDWTEIIASTPNDGAHPWTVPSGSSQTCKIKIEDAVDTSVFNVSGTFYIDAVNIKQLSVVSCQLSEFKIINSIYGNVYLSLGPGDKKPAYVSIFDFAGKQLAEDIVTTDNNVFELKDKKGKKLSNGCYLVQLKVKDKVIAKRFVISR